MHCDGACRGNPGPGGFGALVAAGGKAQVLSGFAPETTNNRMELLGAIAGLESIPEGQSVEVRTDSEYVVKGMTQWIEGWIRKGWRTAGRARVKNRDLWERLAAACARRRVRWVWVRGHAGDPGNEHCDALANEAMDRGARGEIPACPGGAPPPEPGLGL